MSLNKFLLYSSILAILGASFMGSAAATTDIDTIKKEYIRPRNIPFPDDNPYTKEKADLGKILFFDPRISASGTQSCATCHNPSLDWEDGMDLGTGHEHKKLTRTTPTILNLAWDELFFWDGRADSLEDQALAPIESTSEMNMSHDNMVGILSNIDEYPPLFEKAFPGEDGGITKDKVARALATYERTIISGEAPFDRWINGDDSAISEDAKRGFILFHNKANCAACHSGWNFSDGSFHDIGIDDDDPGRGKILPFLDSMQHAFKTVGLRNIDRRAPYMHNGSIATLEGVIDHYNDGFVTRPSLSSEIKPLNLTDKEKQDLVAFLHTLTSEDEPVTLPDLPR